MSLINSSSDNLFFSEYLTYTIMEYEVTDIKYDTDGEGVKLPKTLKIIVQFSNDVSLTI